MTLRTHGHIDVLCDGCATVLCTPRDKPMMAANYAETVGWAGIAGRAGMYCPSCQEAL
jgi:hypothetical protein